MGGKLNGSPASAGEQIGISLGLRGGRNRSQQAAGRGSGAAPGVETNHDHPSEQSAIAGGAGGVPGEEERKDE